MKQVLILVTIAIVAGMQSMGNAKFIGPKDYTNRLWNDYKTKFNKTYNSEAEHLLRRQIWEFNLRYVEEHNRQYDLGQHSYTVGMNQFADMTNEEFRKIMLPNRIHVNGRKIQSPEASTFLPPSNLGDLPETVDWRQKGYVTGIKNQGQCGSCWAFSTTGSLEGQHFKKTGQLVSLSEQQLVDCSKAFGNHGCFGGLMDNGFKYIKANGGIESEAEYPYRARDGSCIFRKNGVKATDTGFVDVASKDENALKQASATVGPISVAIDASHMSFQLYRSGVYDPMICSETRLDHGVLVVGYGTHIGKDYWLVKNSWGTIWGTRGYIMMARNANNKCGIASQASYPLV